MTAYEDVLKEYYLELERLGMYDDFPVPQMATYDEWLAFILPGERGVRFSGNDQPQKLLSDGTWDSVDL